MPRARTQLGRAIWAFTPRLLAVEISAMPATIMQAMASSRCGTRAMPTVASAMVQVPTMTSFSPSAWRRRGRNMALTMAPAPMEASRMVKVPAPPTKCPSKR